MPSSVREFMLDLREFVFADSARIHGADEVDDSDQRGRYEVFASRHPVTDLNQELDVFLLA